MDEPGHSSEELLEEVGIKTEATLVPDHVEKTQSELSDQPTTMSPPPKPDSSSSEVLGEANVKSPENQSRQDISSPETDKAMRTCMPPPSAFVGQPSKTLDKETVADATIPETDKTLEKPKTLNDPKNVRKKQAVPLPYKMPTWSGTVSEEYAFEVLKNGVIVGNVDLRDTCYTVFGRLECCDVVMEHPSISRYHAVVQYRAEGDDLHPKGLYVYDLDSTHGTFLNKEPIRARTYYRLHVGHMLKLGGSSRVFLLQGPPEDQEDETELTVTQMKELRRREELERIALEEKKKMEEKKKEEEGVDWGFGEDAEEDLITENPFALSTSNEDLYLDDPKKTLRGWFEREGYDLEYQVEEKGFGHFACKILLPVDTGQSLYAEASVKGKKKEAVALCALEACRILDRYGLLRQSHHEGRKRKHKNWEDDDFYDSDEDTYLDRTGTIEKKREMRKKLLNKDEVETYDTLIEKLNVVEDEIIDIQKKLDTSACTAKLDQANREQDSLEAFMTSIQSGDELDKKTKSNLRLRLSILQQERNRFQKLANLAQPTKLPPLIKSVPVAGQKMVMIGSMKGGKKKTRLISSNTKTQKPVVTTSNDEMLVENDDDEKDPVKMDQDVGTEPELEAPTDPKPKALGEPAKEIPVHTPDSLEQKETAESRLTASVSSSDNDSKTNGTQISPTDAKKRGKKRSGKWKKDIYDGTNPDYAMWLPPQDQTGDGKTFLNDKFGY